MSIPKAVPKPLIQHNVLSRVAGALDKQHRRNEDLAAARVVDVQTLVAAIVCGGEKLLVDPTVPDETRSRSQRSAKILNVSLVEERPSTSEIATAAQHGGSMLTEESAVEVKLTPVTSRGQFPSNGREITSGHLELARRLADHVGELRGNTLTENTWIELAAWLCDPAQDRYWGNKLLAGLCRRDGTAAEQGESATSQYLAALRQVAPKWEANPEAYWMTNAHIAEFRAGFLPGIAHKMTGMFYGQGSGTSIAARVEFFDNLAMKLLKNSGRQLPDLGALADTAAIRALAWAAVRPILDRSWDRRNPKGLIDAAKKYANGDAAQLMSKAQEIELGGSIDSDLVDRLSSEPDEFVHPHKPRSAGCLVLALAAPTTAGVIAYLSPHIGQRLSFSTGAFRLGGEIARGGVERVLNKVRSGRSGIDVSAANMLSDFLNDETRQRVEGKLKDELDIDP